MNIVTKTLTAAALAATTALPAMAQDDGLKIGMTFQEMNNPYFVSMKEALDEAAASLGAEVIVTDAGHDVAKQISDVEDMLQQNIDILLLNPTDSAGVESAVNMAKQQGVIVVAVDANAAELAELRRAAGSADENRAAEADALADRLESLAERITTLSRKVSGVSK